MSFQSYTHTLEIKFLKINQNTHTNTRNVQKGGSG